MIAVNNNDPKVENTIEKVIDKETQEMTMNTFKEIIELDTFKDICDNFVVMLQTELIKESFMKF